MATRAFDLETLVPASPDETVEFLMQLDRHRGMHTYLDRAERRSRGTDAEGDWTEWNVVERPTLGPLRYRISFPQRMTRLSATSMIGRVRAAPGCTVVTTTTASATDAGTRVAESVVVSAPRLLVGYMTRHTLIAHAHMYDVLPRELGAGTPPV